MNECINFSVTDILTALILTAGCNKLNIRVRGICNTSWPKFVFDIGCSAHSACRSVKSKVKAVKTPQRGDGAVKWCVRTVHWHLGNAEWVWDPTWPWYWVKDQTGTVSVCVSQDAGMAEEKQAETVRCKKARPEKSQTLLQIVFHRQTTLLLRLC